MNSLFIGLDASLCDLEIKSLERSAIYSGNYLYSYVTLEMNCLFSWTTVQDN